MVTVINKNLLSFSANSSYGTSNRGDIFRNKLSLLVESRYIIIAI